MTENVMRFVLLVVLLWNVSWLASAQQDVSPPQSRPLPSAAPQAQASPAPAVRVMTPAEYRLHLARELSDLDARLERMREELPSIHPPLTLLLMGSAVVLGTLGYAWMSVMAEREPHRGALLTTGILGLGLAAGGLTWTIMRAHERDTPAYRQLRFRRALLKREIRAVDLSLAVAAHGGGALQITGRF